MSAHKYIKYNTLKAIFTAYVFAVVLSICAINHVNAQEGPTEGMHVERFDSQTLYFRFALNNLTTRSTDSGYCFLEASATNSYSRQAGEPMLPLYQTMVALPYSGDYTVSIEGEIWDTFSLPQLCSGGSAIIAPAPPARIKSLELKPLVADATVYDADNMYSMPTVQLKTIGTMRGNRVARLTLSPIRYNPVRQIIEVCRKMEVSIQFNTSGKGEIQRSAQLNPMLQGVPLLTPEATAMNDGKEYTNNLHDSDTPYRYMVITPERYSQSLIPFIKWKQQEGYIVEEHYCDGETKEQIKAFLQARYDTASDYHPAPLFILLVGDVYDIPAWPASQHIQGIDLHQTDLFYAEYTGDYLPDAVLGRLPANDTAELRAIIEKTLAYEKFQFADSSHLQRCLIVAGKESTPPAPTATNGQVNRLKQLFTEFDSTIDTLCFYNPSSDSLADNIKQEWEAGVGYVNYTAHCKYFGWTHPLITSDYVDNLPTDGHYFLSINNCCRSNAFIGDCFGEHLLRLPNGGAIGVIGATNETLWDEDYYWSIGGTGNPTLNPQYDSLLPGALDRLLHNHGEPLVAHVKTQGQIVTAGNWAVTASGSSFDAFYWEIYELLGDPSLMPYIGLPSEQTLEIDSLSIGDTIVSLYGSANSRIAATWNDTLFGICTIDSNGAATMTLDKPFHGNILFTATAQYRKPLQHAIIMRPEDTLEISIPQQKKYRVFPNPASNEITIDGFDQPTTIVIADLIGQKQLQVDAKSGETLHIDSLNLPKGVYCILFYSNKNSYQQLLAAQRLVIR